LEVGPNKHSAASLRSFISEKLKLIIGILLTLSVLCAIGAFTVVPLIYWSPSTEFAIKLRKDSQSTFDIHPQHDAEYEIWLVATRSFSWKPIACLMGALRPPSDCTDGGPGVALAWTLETNNSRVASGPPINGSSSYYANDSVGRSLGRVKLTGGEAYRLHVQSLQDVTTLDTASPHIVIKLSQNETDAFEVRFVEVIAVSLALAVLTGLAFLLFVFLPRDDLRTENKR
jgi:hypothetical protein